MDERELHDAARWLLELTVERHPDSARAHEGLAEAALEAGAYEAALAAQGQALALQPADESARRRMTWMQERAAVRDRPVSVPRARLEGYVGEYGPRRVRLENGVLSYRREGNPEYRLIPMAEDLFALDGLETFRIRFVTDGRGPAAAIEGLYFDGSEDRTERSHP